MKPPPRLPSRRRPRRPTWGLRLRAISGLGVDVLERVGHQVGGQAVYAFALGEEPAEPAVHVLHRALLPAGVGVAVEQPRPLLPGFGGELDALCVCEAGVVVGQDEPEDLGERPGPERRLGLVEERHDVRGPRLGHHPADRVVELGEDEHEYLVPVGGDGAQEVHLGPERARVLEPSFEVVDVGPPRLAFGVCLGVIVFLPRPLLELDGPREVDPLGRHEALLYPAVEGALRGVPQLLAKLRTPAGLYSA